MAKTQLIISETATTINSGATISATDEGAKRKGRKEMMAIRVAISSAKRGDVAPSIAATRRGVPRRSSSVVLSVTTMALSTSIPIAMIKPASEVRLIPSPRRSIAHSVAAMEKISDEPTMTPERQPITTITKRITMATDSKRLRTKVLLAWRAIASSG